MAESAARHIASVGVFPQAAPVSNSAYHGAAPLKEGSNSNVNGLFRSIDRRSTIVHAAEMSVEYSGGKQGFAV